MDIIIALIALLIGLVIGFFSGKSSQRTIGTPPEEVEKIIREKDSSFAILQEERERNYRNEQKLREENFETRINDLTSSYETRLKDLTDNSEKRIKDINSNHDERIDSLIENYEKRLKDLGKSSQDAIEEKDKMNKRLVEEMELRHKEALQALKDQFSETSDKMGQQLKNATEEMLKQRQQEFSVSSGEKINELLKPLQNSLQAMQEKVAENTTQHSRLGGTLSESIKNLLDHTESAQASADKLADLLKGNNKFQGSWGEIILQEILESLNFKKGIHFETQVVLDGDDNKKLKPDVVLHLDQNKDVIIDSKVSLTHYLKYQESENDIQRQEALKNHIASIEKHVDELARKDYSNYVDKSKVKMGYVIMFVPNTSALMLATSNKPTLWRDAMERNVYIADEQTLYAALKIVSLTWQQITQIENHKKVYELADQMLDRVAQFMKFYTDLGNSLDAAKNKYNDGLNKLKDGGQSIPTTCRKLIKLGASKPELKKGVDKQLIGLTDDETEQEPA